MTAARRLAIRQDLAFVVAVQGEVCDPDRDSKNGAVMRKS
jgi:hypothetical protein